MAATRTILLARFFDGGVPRVFRGMATLATGSIAARAIGLVSIPILTRLYTPEDFGLFALFLAVIGILAPLLSLRFVIAIPLPRTNGMAMNVLMLSAMLSLAFTLAAAILLWVSGSTLLGWMGMEVLAPWWWLIALGLLGAAAYELLSTWANRRRAYRIMAQTQVMQRLMGSVVKIVLGLFAVTPLGLLLGQVVMESGGIGALLGRFKADFRDNIRHVRRHRLVLVARRYWGFFAYGLPAFALLVLSTKLPVIFFAGLFDLGDVGQFGLAYSVIALPTLVLATNLAKVLFAEVAALNRKDIAMQLSLMKRVVSVSAVLAVPGCVLVAIASIYLLPIILGSDWEDTGLYAALLSPIIVSQVISNPVTRLLLLHEMHRKNFYLNAQRFSAVIGAFFVSYKFEFSPMETVAVFSVLVSIHYIFAMLIAYFQISALKCKEPIGASVG